MKPILALCLSLLLAACAAPPPTLTTQLASATQPLSAGPSTPTRIAFDAPPPTRTAAPTRTPLPPTATASPIASPTPTVSRTPPPTAASDALTAVPSAQPAQPIPPGVTVVLLIGADTLNPNDNGRTDALLLAALHPDPPAITLLSLPRDLLVYIPTLGMERINVAYGYGQHSGYPGGGAALLRDTVAHNFGLDVPYYARTDFAGFAALVDALGGITVSVPCPLEDFILRPGGDPQVEADWSLLTLPAGVQQFDGRTALWYVRSRRDSTDFDRGRRQQDVLRAIGEQAQARGLLESLPTAWGQLAPLTETDLTLDVLAGLAPLLLSLEPARGERLRVLPGRDVVAWVTPDGRSVLLPVGEGIAALAQALLTPPTPNRLVLNEARVLVVNHSGRPDLARVAADSLAWAGLAAAYDDSGGGMARAQTAILDTTGRAKDSPLAALQAFFGVDDAAVTVQPDPASAYDFRVELGADYETCR